MLYVYDLLCRKPKGKFAVIWCLANSMTVSNRDVMKVSILQTVKELQKLIVEQEPYHAVMPSETRLSLYMSTKLCHGTVIAHSIQLDNFIKKMETVLSSKPVEKELEKGKEISGDQDGGKKKGRKKRSELEPKVSVPLLRTSEIPEIGIDIVKHIEETGAAVRADERAITLVEEYVSVTAPKEDEGFGEIPGHELDIMLLREREQHEQTLLKPQIQIHEGEIFMGAPKTSEPVVSPGRELPSQIQVVAIPEIVTSKSPQAPVILPLLELPQEIQVHKSPTVVEPAVSPARPEALPQPEFIVTDEVSEVVVEKSPLAVETSERIEPQPKAHTALEKELQLEPISLEGRDMRRKRRIRRRHSIFLDERTEISREEAMEQMRNVKGSLRVEHVREDAVNIREIRWNIPASQLLKSVTRNTHLQHFITRHFVTEQVPSESVDGYQDEETQPPMMAQEAEAAQPQLPDMPQEMEVRQPPDMAQEMEVRQPPDMAREVEAAQPPDILGREAGDLQLPVIAAEDATGVHETKPDLQDLKESPTRSEDFSQCAKYIIETIEGLSDSGNLVTFAELCPPDKFDRVRAMEMFKTMLDKRKKQII